MSRSDAARSEPKKRRLGVLDLGSTSFHLLVADVSRAGELTPVDRERAQLRLGAVMNTGNRIPDEVFDRALRTARGLRAAAVAWGAEELFAVGTSALREASNGKELAKGLSKAIGVPVRILSGHEEGRLIFAALQQRLSLPKGPILGTDLGGGSLEIVLGQTRSIELETTLHLGAARLHGEYVHSDPIKKSQLRQLNDRIDHDLAPVVAELVAFDRPRAIATGGSARALGHLAIGMRGDKPITSVRDVMISLTELRSLSEVLVNTTHEERLALPGIRKRRADLLPTAAITLLALAEAASLDGYTLCDWGLREAVLLEAVGAL